MTKLWQKHDTGRLYDILTVLSIVSCLREWWQVVWWMDTGLLSSSSGDADDGASTVIDSVYMLICHRLILMLFDAHNSCGSLPCAYMVLCLTFKNFCIPLKSSNLLHTLILMSLIIPFSEKQLWISQSFYIHCVHGRTSSISLFVWTGIPTWWLK